MEVGRRKFLALLSAVPLLPSEILSPTNHPWIYQPSPSQVAFLNEELPRILFSGAAGGGKTNSFRAYTDKLIESIGDTYETQESPFLQAFTRKNKT